MNNFTLFKVGVSSAFMLMCNSSVLSNERNDSSAITANATYTGDLVTNTRGGIRTGARYIGLANISLSVSTENAGLWKGGELYVNGANAHGSSPSANLVGDYQCVSNIDAPASTFLFELWYKQEFGNFEIKAGLQDFNAEFANSETGTHFINGSFGTPPVINSYTDASIYPHSGAAASFKWNVTEKIALQHISVFGKACDYEEHEDNNLKWDIDLHKSYSTATEIVITPTKENLSVFKIGTYYNVQKAEDRSSYGFYATADQQVWEWTENKKMNIFSQVAICPENPEGYNNFYFGTGFNITGLFDKRGENTFGLALAYANINDKKNMNEIAIETFYKAVFLDNYYIKPDLQYIISPAGAEKARNAFAILLRFGFEI